MRSHECSDILNWDILNFMQTSYGALNLMRRWRLWGLQEDKNTFASLQDFILSAVSCWPSHTSAPVLQVTLLQFHDSFHDCRKKIDTSQSLPSWNDLPWVGRVACSCTEFAQLPCARQSDRAYALSLCAAVTSCCLWKPAKHHLCMKYAEALKTNNHS